MPPAPVKRPVARPLAKPVGAATSPKKAPTGTAEPKKASPKETGFMGKSPLGMIVYGPPGVGKTDFAANFPRAGFIVDNQELGINDLIEYQQTKDPVFVEVAETFKQTLTFIEGVHKRGIQTLVLDSATGFEKLCFIDHCEEHFEGDWSKNGFYAFHAGPKNAAKTDWPHMVDVLKTVMDHGINVIVIAHSVVKPFKNPDGEDYDTYKPVMENDTWQVLHRWTQSIFFYNYSADIVKKGARYKADSDSECRKIYTQHTPAWTAKNRYGLDPVIDAGTSGEEAYENFCKAFKKAISKHTR